MIRRSNDMTSEIKTNMRGGSGPVTLTYLFQSDEFLGKARLCARITLEPGSSIGYHEHIDEDEIYFILQGQAVLSDSTIPDEQVLNAGDASITLGGQSHAIRNDGADRLELLAFILLHH